MIKKMMMITLYLALGYQAQASDRGMAATKTKTICMIQAGDVGKLKYRGQSYEEAFSKVTDACFEKRNQLFAKSRNGQADEDRQIQFAEACVNSVKCIN